MAIHRRDCSKLSGMLWQPIEFQEWRSTGETVPSSRACYGNQSSSRNGDPQERLFQALGHVMATNRVPGMAIHRRDCSKLSGMLWQPIEFQEWRSTGETVPSSRACYGNQSSSRNGDPQERLFQALGHVMATNRVPGMAIHRRDCSKLSGMLWQPIEFQEWRSTGETVPSSRACYGNQSSSRNGDPQERLFQALGHLMRLEHPIRSDGSLSLLVVGDWGRRGRYNQSEVAIQ
ncbi:hypothetical protein CRG98_026154, partial [Punica granatum]